MEEKAIHKVYLEEGEDFSGKQAFGKRVVTPIRYSTDPRDIGWVRENIPCQTVCPADTNIPAYIRMITENRFGRSYELNRIANKQELEAFDVLEELLEPLFTWFITKMLVISDQTVN